MARVHSCDIVIFLIAVAFLTLGVVIGRRVLADRAPVTFGGNPKSQRSLGISERELPILHELAPGRSNKEIAAHLHVSSNTVKTHVARRYEKREANRRTDAVSNAREPGIVA